MPPISDAQREALAQRFVRFATQECGAYAPLYDRLARGIAGDPELLTIAAHTRSGQQAPLLLLAAVHYLLLGGTDHALGAFYPSVTSSAAVSPGDPLPAFRYGAGRFAGDPGAPVRFTCTLHGAMLPPIHAGLPQVTSRVGIDLHPIQANDLQAMRWLRALVWPEHPERAALLQQVLAVAQREPPTLVAGDALTVLPQAVAAAPADAALCVFHTATLAHFPPEARERFRALIVDLARKRDLFWLSSEGIGLGERRRFEYVTILTAFQHGRQVERRLAYNHQHGAWLEWLDSADNA
jgi:hypothetical protein